MLRLAVLLSGSGRTLQNLVEALREREAEAEVALVVSSRTRAFGLERARRLGIPTRVLRRRDTAGPEEYARTLCGWLDEAGIDLALMAGFLTVWPIPDRWLGRVMNIHPSLLPAFGGPGMYGDRVHEAALARGVKVSGCTVHFADNIVDGGPIILQKTVAVFADDTVRSLADRVFAQECQAYPEAVELYARKRLLMEGQRVRVVRGSEEDASHE